MASVWPNMSHKQAQHGLLWWETQTLCLCHGCLAQLLTWGNTACYHQIMIKSGHSNMLYLWLCTSRLFRFEKQAHLQICLNLCMPQRGLCPGQHLLIGSLSRIDTGEFHSQNPNSLRGESLYHCEHIGMALQTLFISLCNLLNPFPPPAFLCVSHEYKRRVTGFIWASHKWNIGWRKKLYLVCINPPPPTPPNPLAVITWYCYSP